MYRQGRRAAGAPYRVVLQAVRCIHLDRLTRLMNICAGPSHNMRFLGASIAIYIDIGVRVRESD